MGAEITTDESGKRVVDSEGTDVGIVMDVEDGTAYVEPNQDLGGELKTRLGWGSDTASTYPLRNDAIGEITDDEIHLRGEY
ncbi:hypothetical protein [Natronorubrum daqingense]|uniref:PRC-barrel domain containing protein n=1 Tax=Natronorubrum daqingense TaxID=588898 RepID=A0A1N7ENW5_9EURY|nr:hypothetical protein [Natronorubrum daqingense]APX97834.1 hypothetical protein BB347_15080 [Natronorubrum daqingense]SIR89742.1 hypothetical protein SAMN05421809_2737 [Natronorubrum daqingense]